jgi:hypothetical protein
MTKRNRIIASTILVFVGGLVILWFIIRGYFYDNFINPAQGIDLEKSAQFGDFIGGFVGVIFTIVGIVLLYETLALQRNEFEESRKVFQRQQFENKFFSLLKVYQDIIVSMHYDIPNSAEKFIGKEFFIKHKEDVYNSYTPTNSFYKNRKIAIDAYTQFYIANKENIAHYFRTLYRLFRLIDETKYTWKEKMSYAKIVRGQLSESELFFLNYNACTPYGAKFRELIVGFNLTKHLPLLERVEFKAYKAKLSNDKVNSVNILFEEILEFLKSDKIKFYKTYLKGRFAFLIEKTEGIINISIIRNDNQPFSKFLQEGYGLNDFSNTDLESLLKCWALETLSNRNYNTVNSIENIRLNVNILDLGNNKSKVICKIETKDGKQIKFV